jgi:hypothetical protein
MLKSVKICLIPPCSLSLLHRSGQKGEEDIYKT